MPANNKDTAYINSTVYTDWETRLNDVNQYLEELASKLDASRKLRYSEVDVEAEREANRLQADELYIEQHIIDTNIRREQSPYVQYITQSPRAVICKDKDDQSFDLTLLETDLTEKLRFDGWQTSMFANIDGFMQNGYGVVEVVMDQSRPGEVAHEDVQYGDFVFCADTKDIQAVELTSRAYYFTKSRLLALCGDPENPKDSDFVLAQVEKIISQEPAKDNIESTDGKDASLYKVLKNMFRVQGVVHVAWSAPKVCDDWIRKPRPLYIGRRKLIANPLTQTGTNPLLPNPLGQTVNMMPQSEEQYETQYPYIIFPYCISENNVISALKGRVFLDQDLQEAVASLVSSTVTQARRAAGLYFSKETSDPNDDLLMEKNIFFRSGCLINSKVTSFKLDPPDASIFQAINMLMVSNQNETSQVNFAVNNRKDSRKTAEEIKTSQAQQVQLSTVQVVLFALALTQMYRLMTDIIVSRVKANVLNVGPAIRPLYNRNFKVKPSGDVDVIERQALMQKFAQFWEIVKETPMAISFLSDMMMLAFPDRAPKWIQILNQAQQQAASQQAQMQQMFMQKVGQMASGILQLSKHSEFFSDAGKIHALPAIELAAEQIQQFQKQTQQPQQQKVPRQIANV